MKKKLLSMLLVLVVLFTFGVTIYAGPGGGILPTDTSITIPYQPIETPDEPCDEPCDEQP